MAWYDEDSWLTQALSPKLSTILITLAATLLLPILLHSFLYRKAAVATGLPTFLLVGPSGGGKTAFTTLVCCLLSYCAHAVLAHLIAMAYTY